MDISGTGNLTIRLGQLPDPTNSKSISMYQIFYLVKHLSSKYLESEGNKKYNVSPDVS